MQFGCHSRLRASALEQSGGECGTWPFWRNRTLQRTAQMLSARGAEKARERCLSARTPAPGSAPFWPQGAEQEQDPEQELAVRAVRRRGWALSPWGQEQIPSERPSRRHRLWRVPAWVTHTKDHLGSLEERIYLPAVSPSRTRQPSGVLTFVGCSHLA